MHHLVIKVLNIIDALCNHEVYLGTTLMNQNSIQEDIKRRLQSGNACYHSVQIFFSSNLLSKNIKVKIYETIILRVV